MTALETAPTPTFIIPSFTLQCDIGTIIPVLAAGSTQDIDIVLQRFINEEWCPYKTVFGTSTDLSNAISSQCVAGTDLALAAQYITPGVQMNVEYPTYVGTPTTLNEAVSNIWLALCDVRNRVENYEKESIVAAGDNITVTPVTVANVTTYTVAGKEAIVVAGAGISVTPVTVGNDTTYTVAASPLGGMLVSATPPGIPKVAPGLNTSRLSDAPIFIPTVVYDDDTAYNGATGIWTCPATGRYNISFRIHLTQPAGDGWYDPLVPGILVAGLMSSATSEYYAINSFTPTVIQKHADICGSLVGYSFTAGDTLCLRIMNTTNYNYLSTVGDVMEFSVERIK